MTTIENNILLVKTSIFESVNRTLFTAAGVSLALLASTQMLGVRPIGPWYCSVSYKIYLI